MTKNFLEENLDLIPLSKFNDYFQYPSVAALRQLHFYNTNSFTDKVIRRIGNRIYIKISALKSWIEESNNNIVGRKYDY